MEISPFLRHELTKGELDVLSWLAVADLAEARIRNRLANESFTQ